jgi:hypothetical protein
MRYTFGPAEFKITFEREHRPIVIDNTIDGEPITIPSTHPYTTVSLFRKSETDPDFVLYRTDTVGCSPKDKFVKETGRILALRKITNTLSKAHRSVLWDAYMNRATKAPVKQPVLVGEAEVPPIPMFPLYL